MNKNALKTVKNSRGIEYSVKRELTVNLKAFIQKIKKSKKPKSTRKWIKLITPLNILYSQMW